MNEYYRTHFEAYHRKTIAIDPAPFLSPLLAHISPGCKILDVGCGSGRDLRWLKKRGFQVTGFEKSPELAALAREIAGCRVIVGDFETFDFSQLTADVALLIGALVHLPHPRVPGVMKSILRAVKPSGCLMVTMKEGGGVLQDENDRNFYLWEKPHLETVFARLALTVLHALRQPSALGTGESWHGYVLKRSG